MNNKTDSKLSLVYWLGGSTCAGKSTIANILSETFGFTVYHCDEYLGKHIEKSNAEEYPNLYKATELSWNDILSMNVDEYLSWTIELFTEEYKMILADIESQTNGKPILVEGVNLLPKLMKDVIIESNNAIWLVADETFYKNHQIKRKELFDRINECSNPEKALHNYMNFDLSFGKYIKDEAQRLDMKVMVIENDRDILENVKVIASHFNLN